MPRAELAELQVARLRGSAHSMQDLHATVLCCTPGYA